MSSYAYQVLAKERDALLADNQRLRAALIQIQGSAQLSTTDPRAWSALTDISDAARAALGES